MSEMVRHHSGKGLRLAWVAGLFVFAVCLVTAGCTTKQYKRSADREVYGILAHKREAALGETGPFTIEREARDVLRDLPRRDQPLIPPEEAEAHGLSSAGGAGPPVVISLPKAIEIAILNSRGYQAEKEDVYLDALDLTLERDRFTPSFRALLSGKWQRVDKDESWAGDTEFGVTQLLATGATISLKVSTEFLRHLTGDSRNRAASILAAEIIQPLWRGAGQRVAQENLTQAERDVVYTLRSFSRFHRTFAVSIASSYYRILRQRAVVRNEWNNYQRLVEGRRRSEMLARSGRLPEFEADQTRQDELRARNRWIRSEQTYKERLDDFRIDLGLAADANVDMDERELEKLVETGLVHPDVLVEDAVRQALALRLDLMNATDAVADAERKAAVAANGLGPSIDLVLSSAVGTEGDTKAARFRFDRGTYSAGLDVDLPLERTAARNTYRRSLIDQARACRAASLLADKVKQQVRQAWRSMQEAKESYEIQSNSLALARRRVESTTLLLQAGRATTRDVLESQSALLSAENALTEVLVDHAIARLELWRDIGTLIVEPDGNLKGRDR